MKWLAIWMLFLLSFGNASWRDVRDLKARLDVIEGRKCMLMAVNVPNGTATICASY